MVGSTGRLGSVVARLPRPGLRSVVVTLSAGLVLGAAVITAENAAGNVRTAAAREAQRSAQTVVRSSVDLLLTEEAMHAPGSANGRAIDSMLERLVSGGGLLRIKIWSPEGVVLFSDLPALRGRQFDVEADLAEALDGEVETEFVGGDELAAENVFEVGLADRILEMYLPITSPSGEVIAAYEIYEDAAPIEALVADTRRDVFLAALAVAGGLLVVLMLAFAATSRLLSSQNRRLADLAGDLRRREARFRSLVQNSSDAFVVLGVDGTIQYESVAVERVLGYRVDDRAETSFLDTAHPDDREMGEAVLREVVGMADAERTFDLRLRHVDGSWRVIECVAKDLLADPAVGGIVINYRDITERRALEEQLVHQAFHDPLTGLANRALFGDRVAHALSRRQRDRRPLIVMFTDLDDFKTINDSLGHEAGDTVLVEVAERLRSAIRPGDTVARLGGDEFAFLLEDVIDRGDGETVANRIMAALASPIAVGTSEVVVSASIGIATGGNGRDDASALLRDADVAMYSAKRRNRGSFANYEPTMHAAALARLELEADLRRAIDGDQFLLHYQPIVVLDDGRITGFEALVRWGHPRRGLVGPADFIPVAEATGLIVPIGRWVLREACAQAKRWQTDVPADPPLTMSVNLSVRELQDPGLVEHVAAVVQETGVAPSSLVLEITETSMVEDADETLATLHALRGLGVRLAIDDFGTGYSSLSYLRRLPVDVLKVDRSLVASSGEIARDAALVDAVFRLGHDLGLQTIVEGVEEPEQRSRLVALGCQLGQGFLFARPMDAAAATEALHTMMAPGAPTEPRDGSGSDRAAA
jgi:diguanylate cyclase (GGDEF)-like protein/PAS domain S-box-containing protein